MLTLNDNVSVDEFPPLQRLEVYQEKEYHNEDSIHSFIHCTGGLRSHKIHSRKPRAADYYDKRIIYQQFRQPCSYLETIIAVCRVDDIRNRIHPIYLPDAIIERN